MRVFILIVGYVLCILLYTFKMMTFELSLFLFIVIGFGLTISAVEEKH